LIVEQAAQRRIPAIHADREFVDDGGLMSYSVNYFHLYFRAPIFIDRLSRALVVV
jgi:ABC-type uncharacterized transport system substrate-binding protein